MKRDIAAILAIVAVSSGISSVFHACKNPEAPINQVDAAPIAEDGCVKLSALDSSGVLQTVCALLPDILPLVPVIVRSFAALPPADAGPQCEFVPALKMCLTNQQKLQLIIKLRASDAGH